MSAEDDLAFASIAELGALLRAPTITCAALVEMFLARILRLQPSLNAFITVMADQARAEAARADLELATGRDRGPLHGIPYAVKDLLDTANVATTWGCRAMLDRVPTHDSAIVEQLRAQGAILLGKLNLTELANALNNMHPAWNAGDAPTRNPWSLLHWAGGSSSGAGAAVAAGLCAFAIGSETWGSIDCPAAYCGVTGLRPTFNVVDRRGGLLICPTLDKFGPLARSTADAALVLEALAAPDLEPAVTGRPLRVGITPPPPGLPGYRTAVAEAFRALGTTGIDAEAVTLPEHPASYMATAVVLYAEIMGSLSELIASGGVNRLFDQQPWAEKWAAYTAIGIRGDDYVKAAAVRAHVQRDYQALFERYDVLLTGGRPDLPQLADQPFEFASWGEGASYVELQTVGNLIGAPAITLPIGLLSGLPISVHAMAAPYRDRDLVDLGVRFQAVTAHHRARPPIS